MEAAAAESRFACALAEKLVCGLSFDLKAQSWNIDSIPIPRECPTCAAFNKLPWQFPFPSGLNLKQRTKMQPI